MEAAVDSSGRVTVRNLPGLSSGAAAARSLPSVNAPSGEQSNTAAKVVRMVGTLPEIERRMVNPPANTTRGMVLRMQPPARADAATLTARVGET